MNVQRTVALLACTALLAFPISGQAQTMLMGTNGGSPPPPTPSPQQNAFIAFVRDVATLPDFTAEQNQQFKRSLLAVAMGGKSMSPPRQEALKRQFEQQVWNSLTPAQQQELKAKDPAIFPPS